MKEKSGYWIFVQGDLWILDIRIQSTSEFPVSGPYALLPGLIIIIIMFFFLLSLL